MVRRQNFINKIRELGYTFKTETKRVRLWRKTGSTHYIPIPKTNLLDEEFVVSALRQAGVTSEDEIRAFITSAQS